MSRSWRLRLERAGNWPQRAVCERLRLAQDEESSEIGSQDKAVAFGRAYSRFCHLGNYGVRSLGIFLGGWRRNPDERALEDDLKCGFLFSVFRF